MKPKSASLAKSPKSKATAQVAVKATKPVAKKRRPTTVELFESLSKYEWNFEAMTSAR